MRNYLLIFFSILLLGNISFSQENAINVKQQKHIAKFLKYSISHNNKKIFKLLDKTYRKEQLTFLKGNKTQLIDDLFSGMDIDNENFINMGLENILKIEVAEVIKNKDNTYKYIFRVRDSEHDILFSLPLKKTKNKYGFIGAMG